MQVISFFYPAGLLMAIVASIAPRAVAQTPRTVDPARLALARELARLIETEIPLHYDKREDWGAAKEITVGLRGEGDGLDFRLRRRKKSVEHGVWKHYRLRQIDPEKNLSVRLTRLRPLPGGRVAFTLQLDARLDAWARAKVYRYGIHLIAIEIEGDLQLRLAIDGEIGLRVKTVEGELGLAVEPLVTDARLDLDELHIRRISNARGPFVRLLGEGVRKLAEEELNGPRLTAKLNRAIGKKRDQLVFTPSELLKSDWWPLAQRQGGESKASQSP